MKQKVSVWIFLDFWHFGGTLALRLQKKCVLRYIGYELLYILKIPILIAISLYFDDEQIFTFVSVLTLNIKFKIWIS